MLASLRKKTPGTAAGGEFPHFHGLYFQKPHHVFMLEAQEIPPPGIGKEDEE
jgi:hypothetical protein